jgi:hypothetical protein
MKPHDFEDISVGKILPFVQIARVMNELKAAQKIDNGEVHGSLWCPPFRILSYPILLYA